MGKKSYRVIPLLMAFVLLFTTACGKKKEEELEEVIKPVRIETAQMEEHSDDMEISGNVKPGKLTKVAFKVPGVIERIHVDEGDNVSAGQVLMNVSKHEFEIGLSAAESQYRSLELEMNSKIGSAVDQAEANLAFVNTQLERVKRLHEKGAVATKTVEELELQKTIIEKKLQEAKDTRATSQSQLEQAQAQIDLSRSKIEDTTLHSPVSGTVVKKLTEEGEMAAPGYPTLVLGELSQLEVEIGVPDKIISQIKVGTKVRVMIKGLDKEVQGTIDGIDEAADLETRTFPVRVKIDNSKREIKPGMIANVIINMEKVTAITVPIDAIIDNAEGTFLFIYDQTNEMVNRREIQTGKVFGDLIEVTEGLDPGEAVVVEGQFRLNDGEKVRIVEETRGEKDD